MLHTASLQLWRMRGCDQLSASSTFFSHTIFLVDLWTPVISVSVLRQVLPVGFPAFTLEVRHPRRCLDAVYLWHVVVQQVDRGCSVWRSFQPTRHGSHWAASVLPYLLPSRPVPVPQGVRHSIIEDCRFHVRSHLPQVNAGYGFSFNRLELHGFLPETEMWGGLLTCVTSA